MGTCLAIHAGSCVPTWACMLTRLPHAPPRQLQAMLSLPHVGAAVSVVLLCVFRVCVLQPARPQPHCMQQAAIHVLCHTYSMQHAELLTPLQTPPQLGNTCMQARKSSASGCVCATPSSSQQASWRGTQQAQPTPSPPSPWARCQSWALNAPAQSVRSWEGYHRQWLLWGHRHGRRHRQCSRHVRLQHGR